MHAVQAVYQMYSTGHPSSDIVIEFEKFRLGQTIDGDQYNVPDRRLFKTIVTGVEKRQIDLVGIMHDTLKKDGKPRDVENLMTSILLCGIYEILDHGNVDAPIIINDYIEITKAYYEGPEKGLINAVLDSISQTVR